MINDNLRRLFDKLKKDVYGWFNMYLDFFERVNQSAIEYIYSIGCSFSAPVLFYIGQLYNLIDTEKVVWHLAKFDEDKNETYKERIRSCGFKGEFGKLILNK